MAKHPFLSDDWFDVVEKLVEEHGADAPAQANVMVNLVITDTPFGDERQMHMGATDGKGEWGVGHTDGADVTLTTDYATAKQVFVSGDPQRRHAGVHAGQGPRAGRHGEAHGVAAGRRQPEAARGDPGRHRVTGASGYAARATLSRAGRSADWTNAAPTMPTTATIPPAR